MLHEALLFIPSPSQGVWHLGPFPVRAYAICILIGIFLAVWVAERRWVARGGRPGGVTDVAIWAVPFGIVGARLYHVISSPDAYFGPNGNPVRALYIWEGGLGVWGAIALGAVGAWLGCRHYGFSFGKLADAVGPTLLIGQGIGRLGNWFNQELFGRPTTLPWGLQISPENRPQGFTEFATFHPTFLYELLWNLGGFALLVWLDGKYQFKRSQMFWLYVAYYTLGRVWIEAMRIDTAEHILGLRLNIWTSVLLFALAAVMFWRARKNPADPHPVAGPTEPDVISNTEQENFRS